MKWLAKILFTPTKKETWIVKLFGLSTSSAMLFHLSRNELFQQYIIYMVFANRCNKRNNTNIYKAFLNYYLSTLNKIYEVFNNANLFALKADLHIGKAQQK